MENLDLTLLEGLLFGLKLVLESFDGISLARLNVPAFINMPETAAANQLFLLEFVEENDFAFRRGTHGSGRLLSANLYKRTLSILHALRVVSHLLTVHFCLGL